MHKIREQLKNIIKDLYGLDFNPDLVPSPENIDADYSTNAPLKLAKELHKNPMKIAEELVCNSAWTDGGAGGTPIAHSRKASTVGETTTTGPAQSISVSSPGFLNFTLPDDYLYGEINHLHDNFTQEITSDKYKNQTIICEFSDPNPFKVLHVGHLYTSVVGDSISRLFEHAGANVIRANFGGDVGLHVAKTMYILQQKGTNDLQIEDVANCYIEGTAAYDDDGQAKQDITRLNKEIYKINAEKLHNTPLADLYWRARELSYDYFRDFYAAIGVKFDKYYPESTVAALGLQKVKEQLETGVYKMSNGAVIFDGGKYGLHARVFINREGVPTYEAKDVGLIFTKWQDYHFDKSVVITGNEQKDYMAVVLKSIEQYAPELTERTAHLTHGLVKLPGGVKMSSRKGNFLKAVDVLDMVRDALKSEYNSTDERVSLAAIKYAFLRYKMGGNIIFDPHESVKMTGNSGPYLLYSAVRAKKILSKVSAAGVAETPFLKGVRSAAARDVAPAARGDGPAGRAPKKRCSDRTPAERMLAKKLLEYKPTLDEAVAEMAPHKVANYLYELAQDFSRFYEHCEVIGSPEESERLKLVKAYLDIMAHGLNILGIAIPEEM